MIVLPSYPFLYLHYLNVISIGLLFVTPQDHTISGTPYRAKPGVAGPCLVSDRISPHSKGGTQPQRGFSSHQASQEDQGTIEFHSAKQSHLNFSVYNKYISTWQIA